MKDEEKSTVLAYLHEERFQDCSPAQVYASLLDHGQYHCSIRTIALKRDSFAAMYRFSMRRTKIANVAINSSIGLTASQNCWQLDPTNS